jgi:hypothetical protein
MMLALFRIAENGAKPVTHQEMLTNAASILSRYHHDMQQNEPHSALHVLQSYPQRDPSFSLVGGKDKWDAMIASAQQQILKNEDALHAEKAQYEKKYGSFLGSSLFGWHLFGQMK